MFFEDEKENLESSDYLDDIELDLDEELDDESVTWEELLKEDKPKSAGPSLSFDAPQQVARVGANSPEASKRMNKELDFFDSSNEMPETNVASGGSARQAFAPQMSKRPDAFEVFGGDAAIAEPLTSRKEYQKDAFDDGDESVSNGNLDEFDFNPNSKKDSSPAAFLGALLAVALVGFSIFYIFFGQGGNINTSQMKSNSVLNKTAAMTDTSRKKVAQNLPQDVPVFNEKDAKNLKVEKKIVVSVETSGRSNPFLPTFEEFDDNHYAGIPAQIIAPPNSYGSDQDAQELMQISVSGILFDDVKPSAIITIRDLDYFVQKGDLVDDYKVIDINRQAVVIKKGTNIYKAGVGERFNQSIEVAGSAVYQVGGTRKYSLADVDNEVEIRSTSSETRSAVRNSQRYRTR